MSETVIFSLVYVVGVFISAVAQVLLKKAADVKHDSLIKEYLNLQTIIAYTVFFGATICTLVAYKHIALSMGPILEATGYIFVAILSYFALKEKITRKKVVGLLVILVGVILFSIKF